MGIAQYSSQDIGGGSACAGERRERNEDERREKEEVLGDISDLHRGQRFDNFAKVLPEK